MRPRISLLKIFLPAVLCIAITTANAQSATDAATDKTLYKEIARMDSLMFTAFNTRNVALFGTLFSQDLEFYHDKGGVTGYAHTVDFLKEITKRDDGLKRVLVPGSLEIFPIPGYGAMEIGTHTFCHLENGKEECGTFKFVQVWQKKNNEWKVTRVVSYGH